ncbi:hypothetical protein UFOVP326_65 [uncultured Caudovirales phage]|uniref:Uncharacterized protein n=1 Tax=uncultured Caudovirales phage TaxID=2100421 RepID=A0A6J5LX47_9CAUD|nr:hypothetical protein UFOVP326_65 [uncultured Caudovirales phage]
MGAGVSKPPAPPPAAALLASVQELLPWVREWAELSTYLPGKAKMNAAIRRAEAAVAAAIPTTTEGATP